MVSASRGFVIMKSDLFVVYRHHLTGQRSPVIASNRDPLSDLWTHNYAVTS